MLSVNLIGTGRIGSAVATWLRAAPAFRLNAVIPRGAADWPAAALTIDTAGPGALRAYGARLLAEGELWTVGAAALIDPALRATLEASAQGRSLRLFTGWITGPALLPAGLPATLHITQSAPGLAPEPGVLFDGPLAEAARAFPDHLNTATAAALCGPGIDATRITLVCTPDGGPHVIRARFAMPGQVIETETRFGGGEAGADGPHPVAAAIIAALEARGRWLRYG